MADKTVALDIIVQVQQAESIDELEAGVKRLNAELVALRGNREISRDVTKKLSDARNEAIKRLQEAITASKKASTVTKELTKTQDTFSRGTKGLTNNLISLFVGQGKVARRGRALQRIFRGFRPGDSFRKGAAGARLFSTSLRGVRVAIAATGIGLLVIAVAVLVANWEKIKELITGVNAEQKKQLERVKEIAEEEQLKLQFLESQENVLRLQGRTERQILALKVAQAEIALKAREDELLGLQELRKAQIESAERNKAILQGILEALIIPVTFLLRSIENIGKALGKTFNLLAPFELLAQGIFNSEKVDEEGQKAIDETQKALDELENRRAGFVLAIQRIDKKAADAAAKERDRELEKEEARIKAIDDLLLTREQREIQALEDRFNALIDHENTTNTERIALAIKLEEEIDKILDARAQKRRDAIDKDNERKRTQAEKDAVEAKKLAEEELKREQEIQDAKNEIQAMALGVGADLIQAVNEDILGNSEAFFAFSKGIRIAEATMLAFQASSNALANTPAPAPFPQIAAAAALAQGLLNVRKIAQTKIGRSVPSSGGGPSIVTPSIPRITDLTRPSPRERVEFGPVRAFVVESDIREAQERSGNRISVSEV